MHGSRSQSTEDKYNVIKAFPVISSLYGWGTGKRRETSGRRAGSQCKVAIQQWHDVAAVDWHRAASASRTVMCVWWACAVLSA